MHWQWLMNLVESNQTTREDEHEKDRKYGVRRTASEEESG